MSDSELKHREKNANNVSSSSHHGFIAVHVGAGYHSPTNADQYKEICRKACLQAVELLKTGATSVEAVTSAIAVLEDCSLTNAGTGSNLTISGKVECDASIMDGDSLHYGAIGAAPGIKNPIKAAGKLLEEQIKGKLSLGRVPPCVLVGDGANQWAQRQGIPVVHNSLLITDSSYKSYQKYKRKIEDASSHRACKAQKKGEQVSITDQIEGELREDKVQDTVGAVCVDSHGNVASGVSSGGIVLKQPGRIGQAAMYGCGCWSQNGKDPSECSVAVSTSGCGEHLVKTLLAKECADTVRHGENAGEAVSTTFRQKFLDSDFLRGVEQKYGGALVLNFEPDEGKPTTEILWAHTTDSMCISYMATNQRKPKACISRLPDGATAGKSLAIEGMLCKL